MPYASFHYPGVFTAVIEFLEEGEKYKCSITDLVSKEQAPCAGQPNGWEIGYLDEVWWSRVEVSPGYV
jgi:hypothetical protein